MHNRITYGGADTIVYGSRLIVEMVQAWMYRYADNLHVQDLINAMNEMFRMASTYIGEGYLVNAAIVQSLHDTREDWKGSRRGGTSRDRDRVGGDPRDRGGGGTGGELTTVCARIARANKVAAGANK